MINQKEYSKHIKEEEDHWGNVAMEEFKKTPPDYKFYRKTLPYVIYRNNYVQKAIIYVKPNDKVLELGCYNGWFSLQLARKGANVDAYDLADDALSIGKQYYNYIKKRENLKGVVNYNEQDLNNPKFLKKQYDIVVIRSLLHHILNPDKLIIECKKVLKPGGLIIVDDNLTINESDTLITGLLLFLMPTVISYRQKPWRVLKKGRILQRTQELIEAKGSSPFESVSGEESLISLKNNFKQIELYTFSAFIGSLTSQVKLSKSKKIKFLNFMNKLENSLIKLGLIRGACYFYVGENI